MVPSPHGSQLSTPQVPRVRRGLVVDIPRQQNPSRILSAVGLLQTDLDTVLAQHPNFRALFYSNEEGAAALRRRWTEQWTVQPPNEKLVAALSQLIDESYFDNVQPQPAPRPRRSPPLPPTQVQSGPRMADLRKQLAEDRQRVQTETRVLQQLQQQQRSEDVLRTRPALSSPSASPNTGSRAMSVRSGSPQREIPAEVVQQLGALAGRVEGMRRSLADERERVAAVEQQLEDAVQWRDRCERAEAAADRLRQQLTTARQLSRPALTEVQQARCDRHDEFLAVVDQRGLVHFDSHTRTTLDQTTDSPQCAVLQPRPPDGALDSPQGAVLPRPDRALDSPQGAVLLQAAAGSLAAEDSLAQDARALEQAKAPGHSSSPRLRAGDGIATPNVCSFSSEPPGEAYAQFVAAGLAKAWQAAGAHAFQQ
eukprot:TRINITY_DN1922_c0_g7_i1.p1 TRINITY_DN1922_c0_g7~~TRINITY_DN1922_c0_g7_i1.p1  ORF type:complete len:423 (+),score=126.28 TRINITY_DN1922_c0_g7_i1:59-1327(+)